MATFLRQYAKEAQECLDRREIPPANLDKCPSCHRGLRDCNNVQETVYKCQDCPLSHEMCRECVLREHRSRPFDRIRAWRLEAGFWGKVSLPDLGHVLHLGHCGDRCATVPPAHDGGVNRRFTREMVIMHEHGLVTMPVMFCRCRPTRSDAEQLITAGLWPATWHTPRTATTINALDSFHNLSVQAHVNIHDYVQQIKHATDGVMTDEVKVSIEYEDRGMN